MKLLMKLILLSVMLAACSENNYADIDGELLFTATSIDTNASDYKTPTFIGVDDQVRQSLLRDLNATEQATKEQIRQRLLIELALFSSSTDQTLTELENITVQLQQYSEANTADVEIMAAYGSALSFQAIFYQHNLGKMNFVSRKGMRLMDRAIKQAPNNLGARVLRGVSYANMPDFLNRAQFAVTDLSLVKEQMATQSDNTFIDFINYYLAMALAKNEQLQPAKQLWSSLSQQPDSPWASKATARLKEI